MAGKAMEWGGADVLMAWEAEEMNRLIEEYEAQQLHEERQRLKRAARIALIPSLLLWALILVVSLWL